MKEKDQKAQPNQQNPVSTIKKLVSTMEGARGQLTSNPRLTQQIVTMKDAFGEIQGLIKGQTASIDALKQFSKEASAESLRLLQLKRYALRLWDSIKFEVKGFMTLISESFVTSYKQKDSLTWDSVQSEFLRPIATSIQQADSIEKYLNLITLMHSCKQRLLVQIFRCLIYKKNVLWRDLNAPYDSYIHGEVKQMLNLMASSEEKLGYIPNTLVFNSSLNDDQSVSLAELSRIYFKDFNQIAEALKNYSKLSGAQQVIEDVSRNIHVVRGLRERIETLTISYNSLMDKYRTLQISKGYSMKTSPSEEKSLHERIEDLQQQLAKRDQEAVELRQTTSKAQSLAQHYKDKIRQLEDEISRFQKYQVPRIKEMEMSQKAILEEFVKVRRDLQTYGNLVIVEREEKLKTLAQLTAEKKRVDGLADLLGKEKRKVKSLKEEVRRQQTIVNQLLDKIPD